MLLTEKRKAAVLGKKKNYSSVDKRYKVAGYTEEIATNIRLRV